MGDCKYFIILFLSISISISLWGALPGTEVDNYGRGITVDNDGNVYITGYHSETTHFGNQTLSCGINKDMFLSKLDTNGNWLWTKEFKGIGIDEGRNLIFDNKRHIYFTGWFENETYFEEEKLVSRGFKDGFITKLDLDGNIIWLRQFGSVGDDRGVNVAISDEGYLYLTGWFSETVMFGETKLSSYGDPDIYIARLDEDGNWLWANNPGGRGYDIPIGIATDSQNNCLVCGRFEDYLLFRQIIRDEDETPRIEELMGYGGTDIVLFKVDPEGNYVWHINAGGDGEDVGRSVHVDVDDNYYFTGWFETTAHFGPYTFQSKGDKDIFVAKVDSDGNWEWVSTAGGEYMDASIGIKVVPSGAMYITGNFAEEALFGDVILIADLFEDVFVSKLDFDGKWIWTRSIPHIIRGSGITVATDKDENCYIIGYAGFTMYNEEITNYWQDVKEDILIAKINKNGEWQWVRSAGHMRAGEGKRVENNPLLLLPPPPHTFK